MPFAAARQIASSICCCEELSTTRAKQGGSYSSRYDDPLRAIVMP
jgi:hypothetical protein